MIKRICSVCGKEFSGGSAAAKYCSEACRNTPVFTDEFNGEVRGQLKVINAYRKNRRLYVVCRCKCGNTCTMRYDAIASGKNVSCGCARLRSWEENIIKAQNTVKEGFEKNTSVLSIIPRKMLKNNTSGVKGVYWDREREKWVAQIEFQGKNYRLGRFNDIEDAAAARKEAEKALFGNFLDWFREAYPERWKKLNKSKTRSEK